MSSNEVKETVFQRSFYDFTRISEENGNKKAVLSDLRRVIVQDPVKGGCIGILMESDINIPIKETGGVVYITQTVTSGGVWGIDEDSLDEEERNDIERFQRIQLENILDVLGVVTEIDDK